MASPAKTQDYRYRAFISYCHQDERWATWLHKALEGYRVPRYLVGKESTYGPIPRRLAPIFRDRDELPTATDLGEVVNEALRASACLILVCSPQAARSRWVNQEILTFKRYGRSDRIYCLIVGGEPNAADKPELEVEECFPEALRFVMDPNGTLTDETTEPIAADVRPQGDGRINAKLKIAAGMLGIGLDELKHRDQHRRHQRMAAITVTALGAMIVTTFLAINAIVAQHEAERRREQAEDLISFMLGDLRQRLEPVGRLDLLDSVGDKALEYFASLPDKDVTDESLGKRALALCQIGEVRVAQGDLDQAITAFSDCLASSRALSERDPGNGPRLFQLGQAYFWTGYVHWQQGQLDAAEYEFRKYLDVSRQLVEQSPDNQDWRLELSYSHNNLGSVQLARGSFDQALEHFRVSIEIKESLVKELPESNALKLELADSYSWFGTASQARGNLDEALDLHNAEVEITKSVLQKDPANTGWQRRLSRALQLQGRLLEDLGDEDKARDPYERAIAISSSLFRHDTENTEWQRDLSTSHIGMGRVLSKSGDLTNALAHFRQSAALSDELVLIDGSVRRWQLDAARAHRWVGRTLFLLGNSEAAIGEVNRAIAIIENLPTGESHDQNAKLVLSEAYMLLGQIRSRRDEVRETSLAFARAIGILEPVANGTTDKTILDPWARALLHVNRVDDARPVVEKLHRMGFKGRQLAELCRKKGLTRV